MLWNSDRVPRHVEVSSVSTFPPGNKRRGRLGEPLERLATLAPRSLVLGDHSDDEVPYRPVTGGAFPNEIVGKRAGNPPTLIHAESSSVGVFVDGQLAFPCS